MDEAKGQVTGSPPVATEGAGSLVLGSMPGEASLKLQQYYGHPRNHFWRLLYALLEGGEPPADYGERLRFAQSRGIALWDVLRACERQGSLDSAIRKPETNDFTALFRQYPGIRCVFFNGTAAADFYRRHVFRRPWKGLPLRTPCFLRPARPGLCRSKPS
ncbi:DNA-deoxyinosine glycosylase [Paenibacillus sp. P25]|nr:DNA-deoxyinosine glycosylase [Paenibacillus sp. P25]